MFFFLSITTIKNTGINIICIERQKSSDHLLIIKIPKSNDFSQVNDENKNLNQIAYLI